LLNFIKSVSRELAGRLLRGAVNRTPVDTGVLRAGWTAKTEQEAKKGYWLDPVVYASRLPVEKNGNVYTITIINPVFYASYVEYGHRQEVGRFVPAIGKRLKNHWVEGQFMLTKAEMELEGQIDQIIEQKILKFLKDSLEW
jgi:hypothetical protein